MKYLVSLFIAFYGSMQVTAQSADILDRQVPGWLHAHHVPAAAVAIIEDGKLTYSKVYGSIMPGVPAPGNTIFNVASLTKPIVSIVVMKMIHQKAWDLDTPLYHYWTDPDVAIDERHKLLTTRLVLSHQTGFLNWRWLNGNSKLAFQFDPGTKYQYSGEGFEYLRKAIERKTGKSLQQLAHTYLFEPLKMTDTRFIWHDSYENRFARWHDQQGLPTYTTQKRDYICAADDLMTTIADYGAFAAYVLNGAGIDPALFSEMVDPKIKINASSDSGLGWIVVKDLPDHGYALFHAGADMGVRTAILLLPSSGKGIVVMTNGDNGLQVIKKIVTTCIPHGSLIIERLSAPQ